MKSSHKPVKSWGAAERKEDARNLRKSDREAAIAEGREDAVDEQVLRSMGRACAQSSRDQALARRNMRECLRNAGIHPDLAQAKPAWTAFRAEWCLLLRQLGSK
jgi:hypothetical protein